MKLIKLEQRTPEWVEWKKTGIGASESSAIMDMNPWKTPVGLWDEKTGRGFPVVVNANIQRGIDNEDEARHLFSEMRNSQFMPACGEHDTIPIMQASFDGLNKNMTEIIEIKCPATSKMSDAMFTQDETIIKSMFPYYWCQVQHQYAVCDTAEHAWLVAHYNSMINWIPISRDAEFINSLVEKCVEFWEYVKNDTEPVALLSYRTLADEYAIQLASRYKCVVAERKALEAQENSLKEQMRTLAGSNNAMFGEHVKMMAHSQQRIDYKKACEDANIDLNPYTTTKNGIFRFTIVEKKQ